MHTRQLTRRDRTRPAGRRRMSALGTALAGLLCAAAGHALEVGEVQRLVAGDGAIHDRDLFGSAVAIDGDTAVIGAYQDAGEEAAGGAARQSGSAYVFTRDGTGAWSRSQLLRAPEPQPSDLFGAAVAIDGDTLVVASWGGDGLVEGSGLAHVFVRDADGLWAVQAELRATDGESGDVFGADVAIEGNTVVIGTRGAEAAYVFDRDPGSGAWRETTRLTPWQTDGQARQFGRAISLHGDTIAVGASEIRGAVYLFARDPSGAWSPQQKLLPLDRDDSVSRFGYSLAQLGDTLLVGAAFEGDSQGAAYAFSREAPGVEPWVQTAKLISAERSSGVYGGRDRFGTDVALGDGFALIGAPNYGNDDGVTYLFAADDRGEWSEQRVLGDDLPGYRGGRLGASIAIDGRSAVVGAPWEDGVGAPFAGAVYSLTINGSGGFGGGVGVDVDTDGDGVADAEDICPGTSLGIEPLIRATKNRFYSTTDATFVDGRGTVSDVSVADAGGCSGQQIIAALHLSSSHLRYGLKGLDLRRWADALAALDIDDLDSDGDGVTDTDDICPRTSLGIEPDVRLTKNRYYSSAVGLFVDGRGTVSEVTLGDTGGCSTQQIILRANLSSSNTRYGLWERHLREWANGVE